jgi:prepilin-type N-terminal cleavage/methylation domain-containing protein
MPSRRYAVPPTGLAGRGFTLIELLVVIGIIAVLIAFLFPVFRKAQLVATRALCASNMRQIGTALVMYANDNDGVFPESTHTAGGVLTRSWIYTLAKYVGDVDRIRISPADPKAAERIAGKGTSYILNEFLVVPKSPADPDDVDCLKFYKLRKTAQAMIMFIISDSKGAGTTDDHTHSRNWFKAPWNNSWNRVCSDISPGRHGGGLWNGTAGSSNYLYGDIHVETISAAELKARTDRIAASLDKKQNFARPPQ